MHVSILLDSMERRHPKCTQHAAGVAKILQKTAHIIMGHPITLLTTHNVVAYVNSLTFILTNLRQQRISKILEAPHLTFTHERINMADRMSGGEVHECEREVQLSEKVRPDLEAEPIQEELNLFTDGCYYRHKKEGLIAGYAVVKEMGGQFETVRAQRLEGQQSAQRAEIIAVTEAIKYGERQVVNIYTDSAYAVGAVHVEMRELADTLLLPERVAIIKCKGHDDGQIMVAKGNRAADTAAKAVTGYQITQNMMCSELELDRTVAEYEAHQNKKCADFELEAIKRGQLAQRVGLQSAPGELNIDDDCIKQWRLKSWQEQATPEEKTLWLSRGAGVNRRVWRGPDGRPVLPLGLRVAVLEEAHGVGHVGISQMKRNIQNWWHPHLRDMVTEWVKTCQICSQYNPKPSIKTPLGKFPIDLQPGREIVTDYTDMVEPVRGYRYMLMCVDSYSGWPEACVTKKEDNSTNTRTGRFERGPIQPVLTARVDNVLARFCQG
ncbi:hypothetical protein MHYP_G00189080 [Metynnis hypsauchen]